MYTGIVRKAELFKQARTTAFVLTCVMMFACQSAPDDLVLDADQVGVIFIRTKDSGTLDNNFIGNDDADLVLLQPISPNGKLTNLTEAYTKTNGSAVDPEISYDGRKVIFSMRQSGANNFDIYEMNVDGTNLRRVTNTPYDEADPAYLPNGKIVYTCNQRNIRDEYERRKVDLRREVEHTCLCGWLDFRNLKSEKARNALRRGYRCALRNFLAHVISGFSPSWSFPGTGATRS